MPSRIAVLFLLGAAVATPDELTYQKPPREILDVLHAPPPPLISVSPSHDYAILMQPLRYPPIAEVAQPMLRLAGLRIDIHSNGPHLAPYSTSYSIKRLSDGSEIPVSTPGGAKLSAPVWSPDGKQFAFSNTTSSGIELWTGNAANGQTRHVPGVRLNAVMGQPIVWLSDSRTLLLRLVPEGRGQPPAESETPTGPHVQESSGRSGPVVTFEDMLSTPHDEDLFDYYAMAQLAFLEAPLDGASPRLVPAGNPEILAKADPSPDGRCLLISRVHHPYSYLYPVFRFPEVVEVWDRAGKKLYQLADLPLADRIPVQGVRTGPREYEWRPDQPASLMWVEAMDGGNPKEKVPHRDRILTLDAPFQSQPHEVFETVERFTSFEPLADGKGLVTDYERNKRWTRTIEIGSKADDAGARVIFSRNVQDRYHDPGLPGDAPAAEWPRDDSAERRQYPSDLRGRGSVGRPSVSGPL